MLDDLSLTVTVTDDKGNLYAPFYNPELVENNIVAQETIEEYNKVMDRLSKKKVTTKVKDMSIIRMIVYLLKSNILPTRLIKLILLVVNLIG